MNTRGQELVAQEMDKVTEEGWLNYWGSRYERSMPYDRRSAWPT
jgi:hypothetical protein